MVSYTLLAGFEILLFVFRGYIYVNTAFLAGQAGVP